MQCLTGEFLSKYLSYLNIILNLDVCMVCVFCNSILLNNVCIDMNLYILSYSMQVLGYMT